MDVTHTVAQNVKRIREEKKLTLDAASALTGVSRSMLAQIEKGEVNATISVLWKIVNGYKVSFSAVLEGEGEAVSVVRHGDREPLVDCDGRYLNYPLFPFDEQKPFELYRIVIREEGHLEAAPHIQGPEE